MREPREALESATYRGIFRPGAEVPAAAGSVTPAVVPYGCDNGALPVIDPAGRNGRLHIAIGLAVQMEISTVVTYGPRLAGVSQAAGLQIAARGLA